LAFIELENFGIVSEVKDEKLSVRQVGRQYLVPFGDFDADLTPAGSVPWIRIPNHDQKGKKLTLRKIIYIF
jgi:hypothetical protein